MPITVKKLLLGGERRGGESKSLRDVYRIRGAEDDDSAEDALLNELSPSVNGLLFKNHGIRLVSPGVHEGWAEYTPAGELPVQLTPEDAEVWEVEGDSETITVTHATEVAWWDSSGSQSLPSPARGAINLGQDGVIDGVQVTVGIARVTNRRVIYAAQATSTYLDTLISAQNSVNNATWRGRAAGEVMFNKFRTVTRANGDVELVRNWTIRKNQTGLIFGDITGVSKDGHDHVWVHARDFKDTVTKTIQRKPLYVVVDRPFPRINFAVLEPPTL